MSEARVVSGGACYSRSPVRSDPGARELVSAAVNFEMFLI